jgi:hypothetical protein
VLNIDILFHCGFNSPCICINSERPTRKEEDLLKKNKEPKHLGKGKGKGKKSNK